MEESMPKNITVKQASKEMGKSEQFIRIGLRTNRLPFGSAVLISTHWTYYISPTRFYDFVGKEVVRKKKTPKKTKKEERKKA